MTLGLLHSNAGAYGRLVAQWLRGLTLTADDDEPGFRAAYGYHDHGAPWQEQRDCD